MHPLFPKALPDETIFSLVCRFHLLAAQASFKGQTLPLLGINGSRPSNEFPSFLPNLAKVSGINLEFLIKRMTSLHYYEPFIDKCDYQMLSEALRTGETSNLQSKLGMVANRITPGQYLKYCPLCSDYDENKFGVAYWHKVHQLVGLTVCPIHQCHLVEVKRKSVRIILPYNQSSFEGGVSEECELSKIIVDEFKDTKASLSRNDLNQIYMNQLSELGFITQAGHIRQQQLKLFIADKLGVLSCCSSVFKLLSFQSTQGHYPECLFYASHCNHQPIKHFFFIYVLFGSWSNFCLSYERGNNIPSQPQQCNVSLKTKKVNWTKAIDEVRGGLSLRTVANHFHTTVSTLKIKAQQQGVEVNTRPSKVFKDDERVIWRMLLIGVKTQDIAKKFELSVGAIEKILTKHHQLKSLRKRIWYSRDFTKHQKILSSFISAQPNASRNQIKASINGTYMWLYKHETTWLYDNLPQAVPRAERYKRSEQ
jgi:hypothetical protein